MKEGSAEEGRKLLRALRKKALGYTARERVSEYVVEDGKAVEVKRRVHCKHVPGDLAALRVLMERQEKREDLAGYSEQELEREKARLLALLENQVGREEL